MRCYYNQNTKVFKHTCDVIEDYLCYFLTGIGSIALAVRFLTSLGSGEVVCAIKGEDFEVFKQQVCQIPKTNWIAVIFIDSWPFQSITFMNCTCRCKAQREPR